MASAMLYLTNLRRTGLKTCFYGIANMSLAITKEHIKSIKKLHDHKERKERGLFLIEGIRLMEEAVKERVSIEEALYTDRLEETGRGKALYAAIRRMGIPIYLIPEKTLEAIAETENPQGILAVARQLRWEFEDIAKGRRPVIVACGLQDPGNLGTIIRTADAGGCGGVITIHDTVDSYNSKVIRATMGSIFRLPVLRVDDPKEAISSLKKGGYQVLATTMHSKTSYLDIDYRRPTAFLIGQEAAGLPKDIMESADIRVFIPMRGGVESLNAAMSAGILIYEAFRQRVEDVRRKT
jgi:TrmH family RNA methyltransferase